MAEDKNGGPNYLQEWRELRDLTQEELAEEAGTTGSVISLLEAGDRGMSLKWMRRLAPALKVSPGQLAEPPDQVIQLPTDEDLESMVEIALRHLPPDRPYPRALASSLREQLLRYPGVRANGSEIASEPAILPAEAAQSRAPTKKSALAR